MTTNHHPPGTYVGMGLVFGSGAGAAIGVVVAGGPGIALGAAFGGGLGIVAGAVGDLWSSRRSGRESGRR